MHNCFTEKYPVAFHVFPLNRARKLWESKKLLGKQELAAEMTRRTSRDADRQLGFGNVVHWYLGRSSESVSSLPVLLAQMSPSPMPAIPHAALELVTSELEIAELRVCNWNVAVSRPAVAGYCQGGNWTRGTDSVRIAEVWRRFRDCRPDLRRARGFWKKDYCVPLLEGSEVIDHLNLLSRAAGRRPELILDSGFAIDRCTRVLVFCNQDKESIGLAGPPPGNLPVKVERLSCGEVSCSDEVRAEVESELRGLRTANLDFDAIRPTR